MTKPRTEPAKRVIGIIGPVRPLVPARLVLAGVGFEVSAAVADRQKMKYEVIVGVDILRRGRFLIDPARGVHGRAGGGTGVGR